MAAEVQSVQGQLTPVNIPVYFCTVYHPADAYIIANTIFQLLVFTAEFDSFFSVSEQKLKAPAFAYRRNPNFRRGLHMAEN